MKLQIFSLITLATTMMVVGCTTDDKTTTDKTTSTTTESSSTTDPSTTNDTTGTTNPSTTTDSGTDTDPGTGTETTTDTGTGSDSESGSESESAGSTGNMFVPGCGWSADAGWYACASEQNDVIPGLEDNDNMDPLHPIACPDNWKELVGMACNGDSPINDIGCCVSGQSTNVYCLGGTVAEPESCE